MDAAFAVVDGVVDNNKVIVSFLLIALGLLLRWVAIQHFSRLNNDEEGLVRRWSNSTKNAINLLTAVGLVLIWLSELRFVALSIATFIVALVIATREFIQCFVGALYQTSTRTFTIGDWIKVNNQYGEVVATDWLSTTLLEIDMESMTYAYTGRTLIVPNNQFVANTVQNLNFMRRYIAHTFTLVREPDPVNLLEIKPLILEKAKEYCKSFEDVAQRYNGMIEKKLGVTISGPGASVRVGTSNLGKNQLTVSLFCPTDQAIEIEQKLTEDFLTAWYEKLAEHQNRKLERE